MIIFLNLKSININKLKYVFTRGKAFNKTVPVLLKSELVELMDDDDDDLCADFDANEVDKVDFDSESSCW